MLQIFAKVPKNGSAVYTGTQAITSTTIKNQRGHVKNSESAVDICKTYQTWKRRVQTVHKLSCLISFANIYSAIRIFKRIRLRAGQLERFHLP